MNKNEEQLTALKVDYAMQPDLFNSDEYTLDEGTVSPAEARLRSENALRALGDLKELPAWYSEYQELLKGGWPWRVAAYIAWASMPKAARWPETQEKLATDVLGLTSDRQITKWRKKPAIFDLVCSLQAAPLLEHRADVFNALIISAGNPDYKSHQDRKLFLEITRDYVPASQEISIINKSARKGVESEPSEALIRVVDDE